MTLENEPEPNAAPKDVTTIAATTPTPIDSTIRPAHASFAAGTAVPLWSLHGRRVHWEDDQEEREVSRELNVEINKDGEYLPTDSAEEEDPPTDDEEEDDEVSDGVEEMEAEDPELQKQIDAPKKKGKGRSKKGMRSGNGGQPVATMAAEECSKCLCTL